MKKENKKPKRFQKKRILLIGLLSLLVIGLVSAGIVNYLSNEAKANIEVTSPMVAGISLGEGKDWGGDAYPAESHNLVDWEIGEIPLQISTTGGGTVTLYTMSANVAEVDITGFEEAIVTNEDGVTCEDFDSVIVRVDSIYGDLGYGTPQELIGTGGCQEIDGYVQFGSPANSLWSVGETDVSEIVVVFNIHAFGTYTFTYQVI